MSAQRASEPDPAANPFAADRPTPIRLPGNDRTYEVRDVLRGMGLRWDPKGHAWHGSLPATERQRLERDYGLVPRVVRPIESFQATQESEAGRVVTAPNPPLSPVAPGRIPRDSFRTSPSGSSSRGNLNRVPSARTRFESRLAFGAGEEDDADEIETQTRRFSLFETTSGLPDDSREEDERREEHYLRDARARVKLARAVVSRMPGLAAILRARPDRAARFFARFAITEAQFRYGATAAGVDDSTGGDERRPDRCFDLRR